MDVVTLFFRTLIDPEAVNYRMGRESSQGSGRMRGMGGNVAGRGRYPGMSNRAGNRLGRVGQGPGGTASNMGRGVGG